MTGSRQVPVAEGLFTWPSEDPRLIGTRCAQCGLVAFPAGPDPFTCQRCGGTGFTETLLPGRGTLWTFTTQDFRPPSPPYDGADTAATFQPYALGYVELGGEVMVEARLTEADPARLSIGQPMRLAIVPYSVSPDGTEIMTFAFAPCSPGGTTPPDPPGAGGTIPPRPLGTPFGGPSRAPLGEA